MVEHNIGGLPVMGEDNRIVGKVTETDLFKTLAEFAIDAQSVTLMRLEQR